MTTETKTPVVIYARYSTIRQDDRSIEDQVRRCERYAKEHDLNVVGIYSDAAQSGAHLDRAEMQRLLGDATKRGGTPFKAVLVDDLSRLSRDLGNTWRLVFEDLATCGVKVTDVSKGMSSDAQGARLMFGTLALVNDHFLEMVRTETHRGLEGRALAGFSTGGRVYGFSTVKEENPQDPLHPRARPVINEAEAAVIRRIFELFIQGNSTKAIAARLNAEGIRAPYDGGHGVKTNGRGWPHSTIGNILANERYIGTWVWNQFQWKRHSGKKSRIRIPRPAHEHIRREYPELAIVSKEIWDAAQSRLRRRNAGKTGRPAGTGNHVYLFTGLLRCGVCGKGVGVTGQKQKNGVKYVNVGCNTHESRGSAICANDLTISERKLRGSLVCLLQQLVLKPEHLKTFTDRFRAKVKELQKKPSASGPTLLEVQVQEAERRINNVTEAMAKVGYSDAMAAKLKGEEQRLTNLKSMLALQQQPTVSPLRELPPDIEIQGHLKNLLGLLTKDIRRGRESLLRCLKPFVLTPVGEGTSRHYHVSGALNLLAILKTPTSLELEAGVSGNAVCGGRI